MANRKGKTKNQVLHATCHVSHVICHVSQVICPMSRVKGCMFTCHRSLTVIAAATVPHPTKSIYMHCRLVYKDQRINKKSKHQKTPYWQKNPQKPNTSYMSLVSLTGLWCPWPIGNNQTDNVKQHNVGHPFWKGLKNYAVCNFSKVMKTIKIFKKIITSCQAYEKNAQRNVLRFMITHIFVSL